MFKKISSQLKDEIESVKIKHQYKKKQFIYKVSESPTELYLLEHGLIGLVFTCENGNDHLLRIFKSGQFFGHRSLFSGELYHGSSICLEDCEISFIDKKNINTLIQKYPEFTVFLLKYISIDLGKCETHRIRISEKEVIQRAADAIVYLSELAPEHKWTRLEIAQYCESTSTTIVKVLSKLEKLGMIKQSGHRILILNREGLLKI
jgi:CRP-like cAMP-binding protein